MIEQLQRYLSQMSVNLNFSRSFFASLFVLLCAVSQPATAFTGLKPKIDPSAIYGPNGFVIGWIEGSEGGLQVASAGDVNGDGFEDIIIGIPGVITGDAPGRAYVVFGNNQNTTRPFSLRAIDGSNGFALTGNSPGDLVGGSVSAAGDINNDGIDDLIVGARVVDVNGVYRGASYIVYGSTQGFPPAIRLSDLDGSDGFAIHSTEPVDDSALRVSFAGDINGDGYDDVAIGAPESSQDNGAAYIVFGNDRSPNSPLMLQDLNGDNGFALTGKAGIGKAGDAVSAAGDINGDGIDDVLVGAPTLEQDSRSPDFLRGETYVIYGSTAGFDSVIYASALDGETGFTVQGADPLDFSGGGLHPVGDWNFDGFDDFLTYASNYVGSRYGVHIFKGSNQAMGPSVRLSKVNSDRDIFFQIATVFARRNFDFNGDGKFDIIFDPLFPEDGERAVLFGTGQTIEQIPAQRLLDGTDGVSIIEQGRISDTVDFNGDGYSDVVVTDESAYANSPNGAVYIVFGGPQFVINPVTEMTDESVGTAQVSVRLSAPQPVATTVMYATNPDTCTDAATRAQDFYGTSGVLSFAPGVTEQLVPVSIRNDATNENDETLTVRIFRPGGGVKISGNGKTTLRIKDDDAPAASFSLDETVVVESEISNQRRLKVSLSAPLPTEATISYAIVYDATSCKRPASPGSDYFGGSGILTFSPGATTRYLTLMGRNDDVPEVDETFVVRFFNPTGGAAIKGSGRTVVTIVDDDGDLPPRGNE